MGVMCAKTVCNNKMMTTLGSRHNSVIIIMHLNQENFILNHCINILLVEIVNLSKIQISPCSATCFQDTSPIFKGTMYFYIVYYASTWNRPSSKTLNRENVTHENSCR